MGRCQDTCQKLHSQTKWRAFPHRMATADKNRFQFENPNRKCSWTDPNRPLIYYPGLSHSDGSWCCVLRGIHKVSWIASFCNSVKLHFPTLQAALRKMTQCVAWKMPSFSEKTIAWCFFTIVHHRTPLFFSRTTENHSARRLYTAPHILCILLFLTIICFTSWVAHCRSSIFINFKFKKSLCRWSSW